MRGWLAGVLGLMLWLINMAPAIAGAQLSWLDVAQPRSGYTKAMAPRDWQFPRDFGVHEEFQTEWWYYTGNLETAEGRPFGFQLTFFRQAVQPESIVSSSSWRNRQIYSAHFTVSDIQAKQFYQVERFSRSGAGLAGVTNAPYEVWLGNWSADTIGEHRVQLQARDGDVSIDLNVENVMLPVLQGNRGLSIKGNEPGNASHYYSLVQQPTAGTIKIQDTEYSVTGLTWKDHEFSTSALSPGTVGWDWFSIQLNDGSALMLYLLRREDGSLEATSAGKYVAADGQTVRLTADDWQVDVVDRWRSSKSGATYPAQWRIVVPQLDLNLVAQAAMPDQELRTATATYWEGAVKYAGEKAGQAIQGNGYVELTGYAARLDTVLSDRTQVQSDY